MVESQDVSVSTGNEKARRGSYFVMLVIGSLAVTMAFLIAATIYYHQATSLGDPLFSNIEESDIVAAKMLSGKHASRYKEPTMVDVPPRLAFEVLSALRPNQPDPRPADWALWGMLEFKLKSGKEYLVLLFHTNDEEAAFRMDSGYYRGGSDAKLIELLRAAEELMEEKSSDL